MRRFLCVLLLGGGVVGNLAATPDPATVYAWYKADAGVLTSGATGNITNWQNQASMGTPSSRNLSEYAGSPLLVTGAAPNLTGPAVRFSGADGDIHFLRGPAAIFGTLSDARTLVVYCKVTAIPTGGGFLFDGASTPGLSRAQTDNTMWQAGVATTGRNYEPTTLPLNMNVWQVHFFSFNRVTSPTAGTVVTHSIGGGTSFTHTDTATSGLAGLILGQPNSPRAGYGLSVDMAELLVYDRLLDSAEQSSVYDYLTNKWAPPVPTLQSGAYAWFKADAGVLTNAAGALTNWQNQAITGNPSSRHLVNSSVPPAWAPNVFGTNAGIRFGGVNNIWAIAGNFGTISGNRTIVACLRLPNVNDGFLFDGSTGAGMTRAQIRDGFWQAGLQPSPSANGVLPDPATLPVASGMTQVHFFKYEPVTEGTRVTHSVVGGASVTYTNVVSTSLGGLIVGENVAQELGLEVDLAELFVYDRSLSPAEQQALADYLSERWDIVPASPPGLSSISPTNGSTLGGTTVTLAGSNFAPGLTVRFGGVPATRVGFTNASLITATTPARAAGTVNVEVKNPDGQSATAVNAFTFELGQPPAIADVAPASGLASGGTLVTITGTNFTPATEVRFGATLAASVAFNSATQLVATTPPLSVGVHDVRVANPDGQFAVALNAFTVVPAPVGAPDPASVYAWYAADESLITSDGYTLVAWQNLGSAATNATYTKAKRDLTQLASAPEKLWLRFSNDVAAAAVTFSGSQAIWAAQSDFNALTGGRTIICYARLNSDQGQGFLFDSSSYTVGLTRVQANAGNWQISAYGANAQGSASAAGTITAVAQTNVWQTHAFVVSTNTGEPRLLHYINGAQVASVTNSVAGALGGLIIGKNASAALGIRADVAEFLVFNSALDDPTRANVESYLAAKWSGVVADPNAPPKPVSDFTRVFAAGDGYTCFRIPALVTTMNGTVIAMSDGRIGSCGDIPTPLDLVIRRSFDNGRTWGPIQVVTDYGTAAGDVDTYPFYGMTNISRVSAGDAALLVDRMNGRIWTLYDNGGISGSRKIKLEMKFSDDDGATWSERIDVEAQNPGIRPSYGEFLTGPGNGIQLTEGPYAGRLVFPVYTYGSPSASMVIYSDDHGMTWQRSANSITYGGEIQVAELPGGELLASMRDNGFSWSGVRTFSRSTDGGITWGEPYTSFPTPPSIPDPQCQGNIFRLTTTNDSDKSRLIHANASHPSSRVNMTLRVSYDEGQSWAVSNQVYAGGSAYSSVAKLATGEVGLLFEKDPYGSLDYVRRSITQITGGADSLPPYTVWAGEKFSPSQLMDAAISGPDADPDGDGMKNQSEFDAGTNPLDAASALKLQVIPNGLQATLQFDGVAAKSYTIQYADELSGAWQPMESIAPLSSDTVVQLVVGLTNQVRFFRVVTPQAGS